MRRSQLRGRHRRENRLTRVKRTARAPEVGERSRPGERRVCAAHEVEQLLDGFRASRSWGVRRMFLAVLWEDHCRVEGGIIVSNIKESAEVPEEVVLVGQVQLTCHC